MGPVSEVKRSRVSFPPSGRKRRWRVRNGVELYEFAGNVARQTKAAARDSHFHKRSSPSASSGMRETISRTPRSSPPMAATAH